MTCQSQINSLSRVSHGGLLEAVYGNMWPIASYIHIECDSLKPGPWCECISYQQRQNQAVVQAGRT